MKTINIIFILFIIWIISSNYYSAYRPYLLKSLIKVGLSLNNIDIEDTINFDEKNIIINTPHVNPYKINNQNQQSNNLDQNQKQTTNSDQDQKQTTYSDSDQKQTTNTDSDQKQTTNSDSDQKQVDRPQKSTSQQVGDYLQKQKERQSRSMSDNAKCDNLVGEEREACLKKKKDDQMANQIALAALKAALIAKAAKAAADAKKAADAAKAAKAAAKLKKAGKIKTLITKLMSGPAGLIILIIVIILENVLDLEVENFAKCNNDEYDLMSLPQYVRTMMILIPNLGDLFDLIGNKLCFKAGCPPDTYNENGLCYKKCRDGYAAVGPVCWKRCGADIDVGALCRQRCRNGYKDVAAVCWKGCDGGFTDIGALCSKPLVCKTHWNGCQRRILGGCVGGLDTNCTGPETKAKHSYVPKTYAKESYGRGAGVIPLSIRMKPKKH